MYSTFLKCRLKIFLEIFRYLYLRSTTFSSEDFRDISIFAHSTMFLIEDLRDLKYFDGLRKILDDNHCRYDLRKIQHLGAAYDTCSVMHYGPYAFSVGNNLY